MSAGGVQFILRLKCILQVDEIGVLHALQHFALSQCMSNLVRLADFVLLQDLHGVATGKVWDEAQYKV